MKLIQQFWGLTVIGSCLLSSPIKATNQKSFDDITCMKKVQKPLDQQITKFQGKILALADNRPYTELTQLHTKFLDLKYDMSQWERMGKSLKIYQWPNQDWHQTITGHVFFPDEIHTLIEFSYNDSFEVKSKIMWRLAIAAYHQHPLAQYYLVKKLSDLRKKYCDEELSAPFIELYQKAISSLSQSTDNNDACFALGMSKTKTSYLGDKYSVKSAFNMFNQGTDFKNKSKKIEYMAIDFRKEEYLKLAQQGYGLAYRELSQSYADNDNKKILFLNKAIEFGDYNSIIELGEWYKSNGNLDSAKYYFKQAANLGIPAGFIHYAICLVGQVDPNLSDFGKDLKTLSTHVIEEAAKHFNLAAQAFDPIGWECLADLNMSLFSLKKTEQKAKAAFDALIEGIKLGSPESHQKMLMLFKPNIIQDQVQNLYEIYGYPPQKGLDKQIENYWESIKKK